MSPGWWQVWQCAWKMRTTSLLNVGPGGGTGCMTARCRAPMNVSATTAAAATAKRRLGIGCRLRTDNRQPTTALSLVPHLIGGNDPMMILPSIIVRTLRVSDRLDDATWK